MADLTPITKGEISMDDVGIGDKIESIKPIKPIKPIRAPKFAAMRTMAEYSIPTPVTRKEMYLNAIAGGVSALPTPITREEKYLAKICGMDVTIPIPLTRYEMYLYKLAGGEWDVPAPVTRIEKYLYHNCGYEIEVPEPITREEFYWNGGQPVPEVLEGVPPLTFTAKRAGALIDYRIYGNTVQNGTPTPDSPIEPEFVGELVAEGEYAGQYVIPISSAGQTKNIYLGQVQTTRRIKKLVLTGKEVTTGGSDLTTFFYGINPPALRTNEVITATSNCYMQEENASAGIIYRHPDYTICFSAGSTPASPSAYTLAINDGRFNYSHQADFMKYLKERYESGNPVVVWYVMYEPEVGIFNEPLCRIGDYADSVDFSQAGVEIPVTAGENTLSVDTEIQPSNMMISYK